MTCTTCSGHLQARPLSALPSWKHLDFVITSSLSGGSLMNGNQPRRRLGNLWKHDGCFSSVADIQKHHLSGKFCGFVCVEKFSEKHSNSDNMLLFSLNLIIIGTITSPSRTNWDIFMGRVCNYSELCERLQLLFGESASEKMDCWHPLKTTACLIITGFSIFKMAVKVSNGRLPGGSLKFGLRPLWPRLLCLCVK